MSVVRNGRKRLVYAETHMNKHSSRSHAVVQIRLLRNSKAAQKALACRRLPNSQPRGWQPLSPPLLPSKSSGGSPSIQAA